MGLFARNKPVEERSATVTQSSAEFLRVLGLDDLLGAKASSVVVTPDRALSVPAVMAAVTFLSGTIAGLPRHVYEEDAEGSRTLVKGGLTDVLGGAANDEMSAFDFFKYLMERVLTTGRAFAFIERNARDEVLNLWPLEPSRVTIQMRDSRRSYLYRRASGGDVRYSAAEVIDLPFMVGADMLTTISPINRCSDAIAMSIAATEYGAKFFNSGGVPPFAVTGNFQTAQAMRRATDDLELAVKKAAQEKRAALVLPAGLEIKPIGAKPEEGQMIEAKKFAVEEIARIYSLPPVFLQDLTHGTFSNTEQQDLHFVKHTLKRWIEQIEGELTLKLFGRASPQWVEFNVDGLLRGDFKTRMEGYAKAVQNGLMTPNEARALENRAPLDGGDRLLIQGATVPLAQQTTTETGDGDDQ